MERRWYNNSMQLRFLILIFGIILLSNVATASSEDILASVTPASPAPLETTNINLSSYVNDLDSVSISWSVDGKKIISGIGQKSFSVIAPISGTEATIIAKIDLPEGKIEKVIVLRPSNLILLWEASDSYVPPFYRGKAMPTLDSEIKVVAMPEIKSGTNLVSPKNMIYAWKKDYTNVASSSGYGKNFFSYTNDYLENSNNVSVVVSTIDQKYSMQADLTIGAVEPKILFYKNDPVFGIIWEKALTNPYKIQEAELIVAMPYFIAPKQIQNPVLVWNWSINDSIVSGSGYRKNAIPLQPTSGVSGTSKLKLNIENMDKIFQTANKEINIEF